MIFITQELFKRFYSKPNGEMYIYKYLKNNYTNKNEEWFRWEAKKIVIILHLKEMMNEIKSAYFYDNAGLVSTIYRYLQRMPVVQENISLYIFAIYDLLVWNRWNNNKSFQDMVLTLTPVRLYTEYDVIIDVLNDEYEYLNNADRFGIFTMDFPKELYAGSLSPIMLAELLERYDLWCSEYYK